MDTALEEWRPVVSYEGYYEVSDQGRVRSVARQLRRWGKGFTTQEGRVLKPFRSPPTNYLTVSLNVNGCKRNRRIHVLVLEAFVGPRPSPEMDACHNNSDPDDNRASNLRWDTKSANAQDCLRAGTNYWANKTHCKRDHEFTPENTYITASGGRQCLRCIYDARKAKRANAV